MKLTMVRVKITKTTLDDIFAPLSNTYVYLTHIHIDARDMRDVPSRQRVVEMLDDYSTNMSKKRHSDEHCFQEMLIIAHRRERSLSTIIRVRT